MESPDLEPVTDLEPAVDLNAPRAKAAPSAAERVSSKPKKENKRSSGQGKKGRASKRLNKLARSASSSDASAAAAVADVLTIHVYDAETSTDIAFKVRQTTLLRRVWDACCQQLKRSNFELCYRGKVVVLEHTPRALAIRTNDVLYVQPHEEKLTIHVINCSSGKVSRFLVKPSTRFDKVFHAYATREGVSLKTIKFCLNGETVPDFATPFLLEMFDEDSIFAHQEEGDNER